jgi:hypothetical protein
MLSERKRLREIEQFLRSFRAVRASELLEAPPPPVEKEVIDHTSKGYLHECDRKYYWFAVRRVRNIWDIDYFIAGKAWDRALKIWESPGDEKIKYQEAIREIQRTYAVSKCQFISDKRTPENLCAVFDKYIQTFGIHHEYEVIESNVSFCFPYKDFFIGGEVDQYVSWPRLGVVIGENKTTAGAISDTYLAGFDLGSYAWQLATYNWAVRQVTENLWGNYVTVASLDLPKRATTQRKLFQRVMKQPSQEHILSVLLSFELAMQKIRYNLSHNSWPMTGSHCEGGWGFSSCEYKWLCRIPAPHDKIEIPQHRFRFADWAPWEGNKGDWESLNPAERSELEQWLRIPTQVEGEGQDELL